MTKYNMIDFTCCHDLASTVSRLEACERQLATMSDKDIEFWLGVTREELEMEREQIKMLIEENQDKNW